MNLKAADEYNQHRLSVTTNTAASRDVTPSGTVAGGMPVAQPLRGVRLHSWFLRQMRRERAHSKKSSSTSSISTPGRLSSPAREKMRMRRPATATALASASAAAAASGAKEVRATWALSRESKDLTLAWLTPALHPWAVAATSTQRIAAVTGLRNRSQGQGLEERVHRAPSSI